MQAEKDSFVLASARTQPRKRFPAGLHCEFLQSDGFQTCDSISKQNSPVPCHMRQLPQTQVRPDNEWPRRRPELRKRRGTDEIRSEVFSLYFIGSSRNLCAGAG